MLIIRFLSRDVHCGWTVSVFEIEHERTRAHTYARACRRVPRTRTRVSLKETQTQLTCSSVSVNTDSCQTNKAFVFPQRRLRLLFSRRELCKQ